MRDAYNDYRMTGPDGAVMCNFINTRANAHTGSGTAEERRSASSSRIVLDVAWELGQKKTRKCWFGKCRPRWCLDGRKEAERAQGA